MIKIAALACANGLGHVRRVVAISTFILKNGFNGSIDLFIPYCHVMTLKNWPDMNFVINSSQLFFDRFFLSHLFHCCQFYL